jgi:ornithine cyclodeaminase
MAGPEVFISEREAKERLTLRLAFEAVSEALMAVADGTGFVNPIVVGRGLASGETFAIKSGASSSGPVVGLKVGSYWPQNESNGLAPHGSLVVLLNPETGRLATIVDASELNGPRTAAADAVAAAHLARTDAKTLTVLGAGHQAEHEIRALCAIRPFERVLISSRSEARALELKGRVAAEIPALIETTTIERGCREADVLITVTSACSPLFRTDWIRPGTHIATMGSDQEGKQELPLDLLYQSRLFCDLPSQSLIIGEFQHIRAAVDSGAISVTAIGDVLAGRARGRQSEEEITVFDSSGIALQDLYICARIAGEHASRIGSTRT